jgi:dipeptidyl aminopeptidase/acylaminoacyl peptidase
MDTQPKYTLYIFLAFSLIFCTQAFALDHERFFERAKYNNIKISPDGKHLAVSMEHENKTILAFLDRETMATVGFSALGGINEVGNFYWVNDERVVIEVVQKEPFYEKPQYYGELYAVNLTGKRSKLIYGYRAGENQVGSRIKKKESIRGWAEIIDILPEDKRHILVSSTPMSLSGERLPQAILLNVYTGVIKREIMRSPIPNSTFITDSNGKIKAVGGLDWKNSNKLFIRNGNEWNQIKNNTVGSKVSPIAIDSSGKYLYTLDNFNQDFIGLFRLNLNDFSYKNIYTDQNVDITSTIRTTNGRTAYGVRVDNGYPEFILLNKELKESKVFKNLLAAFPYNSVEVTSSSNDENFYIVKVSSDINPGSLHLFDKEKNELKLLFNFKPDAPLKSFKEIEPIKFKTSDGKAINGYFTDASSSNTPAPLVILVHGGPHSVRDYWEYSNNVQYLALNGFSVLQINYRGSGGYGNNFERAGFQHWGTTIQQDIYESYQWLIKKNKASKDNACIMGASFGAYSAIQSSIMFPDTYKCAVANAGIYDLPLMFKDGDIRHSQSGRFYLKDTLGNDPVKLKSMSPVYNIEKLSTPILLAHGKEDKRAPFEHAIRMKEALDKRNKDYEWYAVEKEGHGFYNAQNQQEYMKKVLTFLQKHIK